MSPTRPRRPPLGSISSNLRSVISGRVTKNISSASSHNVQPLISQFFSPVSSTASAAATSSQSPPIVPSSPVPVGSSSTPAWLVPRRDFGPVSSNLNASGLLDWHIVERTPILVTQDPVLDILPITTVAAHQLFKLVTPQQARDSLLSHARGIIRRAPGVPSSQTNTIGCWLSAARRQANGGHCEMTIFRERMVTRASNGSGPVAERRQGQLLHRLAVRAWGSLVDLTNMIINGFDVSHLCHQSNCYNPAHLCVCSLLYYKSLR